jgi:hypothetical protein
MATHRKYRDRPMEVEVAPWDGIIETVTNVVRISTTGKYLTLMVGQYGSHRRFALSNLRYFKVKV